ncbi:MAG: hypothetical protein MRY64_14500 [Hyphomonadaceae bacterium]|nr:hypothetical protein [Hyphomonadaceae bacterium]
MKTLIATAFALAGSMTLAGCSASGGSGNGSLISNMAATSCASPAPGTQSACIQLTEAALGEGGLCQQAVSAGLMRSSDLATVSTGEVSSSACDLLRYFTPPSTRFTEITYLEGADGFDINLRNSLQADLPVVTVDFDNADLDMSRLATINVPQANDPKIAYWLYRIRKTDGDVISCAEGSESGLALLVSIVMNYIYPQVDAWLTYRPVGDYHAKIFYEQVPGTPENTGQVNRIEFHRRDAGPVSCEA